jgi:hypothetical protein
VLLPGGRLALNVFGPIENNPATFALARALDRHVGRDSSLTKRAEHALGDPSQLRDVVTGAGFRRVDVVPETKTIHYRSAADYVRIQLSATPLSGLAGGEGGRAGG